MSLLPSPPSPGANTYNFASGDIRGFIDQLNQPVEETHVESPIFDEPVESPEEFEEETPSIQMSAAVARSTGKLLATVTNSAIPAILCAVAKHDDTKTFRATEDEFDSLVDAFTEYSRQKGADIPPGMALLMTVTSIYAVKVPMAIMMAKKRE